MQPVESQLIFRGTSRFHLQGQRISQARNQCESGTVVSYLTMLSVLRLYGINDRMINEYGAVGGMGIGKENQSTWRKPAPVPLCPPQIPRDLESNFSHQGRKMETNHTRCGMVSRVHLSEVQVLSWYFLNIFI
jgi:hypothetical protein